MRYVLEHDKGESDFMTVEDAVVALYLINEYDEDQLEYLLESNEEDKNRIVDMVESGEVYQNGEIRLYRM